MRHLKGINEGSIKSPLSRPVPPKYPNKAEYSNSLKDALSELSDSKQIYFPEMHKDNPSIIIYIKIDEVYEFNIQDSPVVFQDIQTLDLGKIRRKNGEIENILELFKEGLERSQVDYSSVKLEIIKDYWSDLTSDDEWAPESDDDVECDIMQINIIIK